MRKTLIIALGAVVALVTAAVAIAVVPTATGVSAATATFTTDKVSDVRTRDCTGADAKAFKITDARYTGIVTSTNGILAGPLTIHARTTVETTAGSPMLGYVQGSFKVRDDDSNLKGRFSGTLSGNKLVGFLTAKSHGNHAAVLGNITADFAPASAAAFTSGKLGSDATGALAVVAGAVCKSPKPAPRPKPARLVNVHGTVSAVSDTTITVASKGPSTATCTRDATSPVTTGFLVGNKVEMKCAYIGTTWTLRELKHES